MIALLGEPATEKLHVYTIGVGTQKGGETPQMVYEGKKATSQLDEGLLKALSQKGQGRYYSGTEFAALDIATDLAMQIAEADVFAPSHVMAGINANEDLIYDLYFQIPLGMALLFLAFWLFWPDVQALKHTMPVGVQSLIIGFILVWGGSPLCASENHADQLGLAAAYFAAGAYPEAISIYQSLLNEDLTGWERSVVTYNLGTALSSQGDYEKSMEALQSISIDQDTSPLLAFRARKNMSVTLFRQGQKLSLVAHSQALAPLDLFFKAIYFFKQALEEVPLAGGSECHLLTVVSEDICPGDFDLDEMDAISKSKIAEIGSEVHHKYLSPMPI